MEGEWVGKEEKTEVLVGVGIRKCIDDKRGKQVFGSVGWDYNLVTASSII